MQVKKRREVKWKAGEYLKQILVDRYLSAWPLIKRRKQKRCSKTIVGQGMSERRGRRKLEVVVVIHGRSTNDRDVGL